MATRLPGVYEGRYVLLAVGVLALLIVHTSNQQWSTDVWEHSAAVRELSLRPFAPRHPLLAMDAPHHSYSLYIWSVAQVVRWLGLTPIQALSLIAMANAILLLTFFPLAVAALSRRRDLAFYALLLSLFLWGPRPWRYSAFINMNALGFVLPYPSMFATGVTFLIIGVIPAFLRHPQPWRWSLPLGALIFLVLNAHLITAAPLVTGCLALALCMRVASRGWFGLCLAIAFGSLAALAWPLYPLLELIFGGARSIAFENRPMYQDVLLRVAPALLGVPLLLERLRRDRLDPLGLLFGALLLIYAVGGVTANWTLGRVMPFLVLPLFICIAQWVVDQEARMLSVDPSGRRRMWLRAFVAGALVLGCINVAAALSRAVPRAWLPSAARQDPRLDRPSTVFGPLATVLSDNDVIIASPNINIVIPTFGGKVVASGPQTFVNSDERDADWARFFATGDPGEAETILTKYGVTKIVLDKSVTVDPSRFRRFGSTVLTTNRLEVIALARP